MCEVDHMQVDRLSQHGNHDSRDCDSGGNCRGYLPTDNCYGRSRHTNSNIEPVSAQFEPSLRGIKSDIENCGAETRSRMSSGATENAETWASETAQRHANRRECRSFSEVRHMSHRDRTGWLGY